MRDKPLAEHGFVGSASKDRRSLASPKNDRGSVVIEMALGLLLFMTFLCGLMDFGRVVWCYNTVAFAAQKGTRYAIVHGATSDYPATVAQIEGIVEGSAVGLHSDHLTVTTTWEPDNTPPNVVQVAVSYDFHSVVPMLPSIVTLTKTSRMRVHY